MVHVLVHCFRKSLSLPLLPSTVASFFFHFFSFLSVDRGPRKQRHKRRRPGSNKPAAACNKTNSFPRTYVCVRFIPTAASDDSPSQARSFFFFPFRPPFLGFPAHARCSFSVLILDACSRSRWWDRCSRQVTPTTAGRSIATLICLRHTLRLIEPLADALEVCVWGGGCAYFSVNSGKFCAI